MGGIDWDPEWFLGGDVVLDLVNTVPWRLDPDRTIDRLPDATAVVGWVGAVGLLEAGPVEHLIADAAADPSAADAVAAQVRALREALYRLLQPIAVGQAPQHADVDGVRRVMTEAFNHAEITSVVPLRWEVSVRGVRDLPRLVALSAWRLLQFDDLTRLRQCRDADCGWLFLDRSKNASRVWCNAADCGNRTRVRRHQHRHRATAPEISGASPGLRRAAGG